MRTRFILVIMTIPLFAVSCGIGLPFSSSSDKIGGVYKTSNGGADWVAANKTITETKDRKGKTQIESGEDLAATDVRQIIYAKQTTSVTPKLFAASGKKGLYISEDSADSWRSILAGANIYAVGVDPSDISKIYAAGTSGGAGQILLTSDGGKTWQAVYSDTSKGTVQTLSVNSNGSLIAAATSSGSVIISRDKGQTWTFIYQLNGAISQVAWVGSELYILHSRNGLFVSRDLQSELIDTSFILTNQQASIYSNFSSQFPPVLKPNDYFQMAIKSQDAQNIYLATDTGIFQTPNKGKDWAPVRLPIQTSSGAGKTTAVQFSYNPEKLMAAVGGNLHTSLNGGQSWEVKTVVNGGIIRYILPDPGYGKTVYLGVERQR